MAKATPPRSWEDEFWSKVGKRDGEDCWTWTGVLTGGGYGRFNFRGRSLMAHRVSYALAYGVIPAGLQVDHLCHNNDLSCPGGECEHRRCVDPHHLAAVTREENKRRSRVRAAQRRLYLRHFGVNATENH